MHPCSRAEAARLRARTHRDKVARTNCHFRRSSFWRGWAAAAETGGTAVSHESDDWNALLGVMAEGVLRVDSTHVVVDANPAAARLLARPLASLRGLRLAELGDGCGVELVPVHS